MEDFKRDQNCVLVLIGNVPSKGRKAKERHLR
jgi:hypothetical protein